MVNGYFLCLLPIIRAHQDLTWASLMAQSVKNLLAMKTWVLLLPGLLPEDLGSIPGSGRFPRGGNDNPLQCCLENPTEEPGGL